MLNNKNTINMKSDEGGGLPVNSLTNLTINDLTTNSKLYKSHLNMNTTSSTNTSKNLIKIEEFQLETIENLFKFKNENLFTDVYIYVEGVEFPCHKVVLCAASSYFKAMFSCDLKESRLGKVYIENISPWTMKRLLDFIYTGKIDINYKNVIDVFNAAVMFQLYKLVDKCTNLLQQHIDLTNCIEINLFASMHNLVNLEQDTFQFILDNFMQLINLSGSSNANSPTTNHSQQQAFGNKCDEENNEDNEEAEDDASYSNYSSFVRLNDKTFSELIKSDLLNVSREIYVYYALNKWIEHYASKSSRVSSSISALYEALFKHIRLNALSKEELEFILENDEHVKANESLAGLILSVLDKNFSSSSSSSSISNINQPAESVESSSISCLSAKRNNVGFNGAESTNESLNCFIKSLNQKQQLKLMGDSIESKQLIYDTSMGSNEARSSNLRPSTIPREYLCFMSLDQFQFYDFYKSKWDTLSSWPPFNLNNNNSKPCISSYLHGNANEISSSLSSSSSPSSSSGSLSLNVKQRLNGYSTCILNNILYVIGGHLTNNSTAQCSSSSTSSSYSAASNFPEPNEPISNTNGSLNLQQIELVDTVYRFDPFKNEWSTCKPMLKKRAFHISIHLSGSGSTTNSASVKPAQSTKIAKENFIFLFYGMCYADTESSSSESSSTGSFSINTGCSTHLIQCFTVEFYNVEADQWSILSIDNSLLSHHIFQPFNQFNRSVLAAAASADEENISSEANNEASSSSNSNHPPNTNINHLSSFINLQINQSKYIVSLKNLIYVLNENCIHCYEFNTELNELVCLPYFRLPISLNNFTLATAMSVKASQLSCMSLFSWYSDDEDPVSSCSVSVNDLDTGDCLEYANHNGGLNSVQNGGLEARGQNETDDYDDLDEMNKQMLKNKREALIYILSPQQGIIYEFYPAKNKLKKLPNLLLKHSPSETVIMNVKSKLYVTGGILEEEPTKSKISSPNSNSSSSFSSTLSTASSSNTIINQEQHSGSSNQNETDTSAIEVFDQETNTWSIFMNKLENSPAQSTIVYSNSAFNSSLLPINSSSNSSSLANQIIPIHKHFFKLKMSLF